MSNKHKSVIPKKNKGMTFNSLEAMGNALGFKSAPALEPPKKTCTVCKSVMRHIPETNVWVCDGTKSDGKPCTRRIMSNPRPADKVDENPKPDFKIGKENRRPKPKGKSFGEPKAESVPAFA